MATKFTGIQFDATQVAPAAPMEAIPAGWYNAVISDGETKPTNDGTGRRLALEWTITEGPYKGRKIFDGLNIQNNNPDAQRIAQEQLSAICHAVQVFQITDIGQLQNKVHQIKVGLDAARWVNAENEAVEPNTPNAKFYEARNQFKGAKAAVGAASAGPGNVATGGAPAGGIPDWAKSAQAGGAPAGAAPVAGKPGKKPKAGGKPAPTAPVTPPKVERMFYVALDGPAYEAPLPESKVAAMLAKGMPADTGIVLVGESDYKTGAEYGVGVAAPAAAPAAMVPPATGKLPWED